MSAGRPARRWWGLAALLLVGWAVLEAGLVAGDLVNRGGWSQVRDILGAAGRPALGVDFLARTTRAAFVTLAFAVLGTFLSLILGTAGGVLGSEVWWATVASGSREGEIGRLRAAWLAVRGALALPRAIHEILWGLFFINIFGLDPIVGVLAIAIPYGAITAKLFSEILDETSRDALRALRNAGASPAEAFLYGLVPEAFRDLLSYAFYRFECSIRSAAVLGIIGAGGLGYELFLSLQSLRYPQMWTLLGALILLTGATDLWSGFVRRRLGGATRLSLKEAGAPAEDGSPVVEDEASPEAMGAPAGDAGAPARPRRDPVITASLAAAGLLLAVSAWYIAPHVGRSVSADALEMTARLARDAFPPTTGGLTALELADLSAGTLAMSVLAIALATAGGVLFAFPAASSLSLPGGVLLGEGASRAGKAVGTAAFAVSRSVLLVLRAVPAPIWALVLLFVFFPGILPGALALGLYTMGVLGRLMSEVAENLDRRPLEALRAQGASGAQVFLYGVLPAAAQKFLSYVLYRWEVSIRGTVMVGLVGAGSLGVLLTEQLSSFDYSAVLTTLGCYVLLTFAVDMISARARSDLR